MTIYLALDPIDGGPALPSGRIAGIGETSAGLTAQGFSQSTYRQNRRRSIDETDSDVWDNDCEPGWFYNHAAGAVQLEAPMSDLDTLKSRFRAFHDSAEKLSIKLSARAAAGWHSPELVLKGQSWIFHAAHEAAYMVGLNTSHSAAVKARFALVGKGILDAIFAETDSTTLYTNIEPIAAPTGPVLLIDLQTGDRLAFTAAVPISPGSAGYPELPTTANLGNGAWIDRIA